MFTKLFASSGLSLDRLRSFLEVAAAGGITKAAGGDPVKQSQYSRQVKELEDFFAVPLMERHGRGVRLTANGRELARIGRYFLLGLSNFQGGCRSEAQTVRVAGGPTFAARFLAGALARRQASHPGEAYTIIAAGDDEIGQRLHDLTLDFGIVASEAVSRPLKTRKLFEWRLHLWSPRQGRAREGALPVAVATGENAGTMQGEEAAGLSCPDFGAALAALNSGHVSAVLPDYLGDAAANATRGAQIGSEQAYYLAWNPRSIRLNPGLEKIRGFIERECRPPERGIKPARRGTANP